MTTRGNERLAWIDSLRGLAALLVVYSHCPLFGREGQMILDVSGQLGVDVFFIISGYVVPSSISANHAHPLRVFAIRRFWRLYPLYWLSIPFGLLVLPSVPSTAAIVANVTMAQRYLGASDIISVYWTLSIELLFYGLTAAAWGLGWLSRPDAITRALLILMGLVVAGAMAARWGNLPVPAGSLMFLLLMVYGTWLRLGSHRERHGVAVTLGLIAVLGLGCWLFYSTGRLSFTWTNMFAKFALAPVIFLALRSVTIPRTLPFAYLGVISYSLYLMHQPIFMAAQSIFARIGLTDGNAARGLVWLMVILASAGLHHALERPCIGIGRAFTRFDTAPSL